MNKTPAAALLPAAPVDPHDQLLMEAARELLGARRALRHVLQQAKAQAEGSPTLQVAEGQLYALHMLDEAGMLTAGDLAERCHVADPTMSKTLNHLEEHGLVERRIDPSNRRVVQVTLSPTGQALLRQARSEWVEGLAAVLRPLTSAQLSDLIVALGHLDSLARGGVRDAAPRTLYKE